MVDYSYLHPQKAEALRVWHEEGFTKRENLKCESKQLPEPDMKLT